MRRLAFLGIVGVLVSGCVLDSQAGYRPARFHAGPNMRALRVPVGATTGAPTTTGAARTSSTVQPQPETARDNLSAVSAALQFTMQYGNGFYLGGEVETGRLEGDGSNFAGAYGVVGAEHGSRIGSLGAELATGWRGLRYHYGDDDENQMVIEPRVRAQLRISQQLTLGSTVGTTVGASGEWMAGVYLGVHSIELGF